MKKTVKKLALTKETLRDLRPAELRVQGGMMPVASGHWYCLSTWAGCSVTHA
jgi:hypothetical protein